ncbi:MAG: WGR domain-containing protein [Chloroflexota bacterium]
MNWETPPLGFHSVLFDRTEPGQNAYRYYLVAWWPTLLDEGAVIRTYGRKGASQTVRVTPFPSLAEARPLIRATIKTRLRHRYRVVEPEVYRDES